MRFTSLFAAASLFGAIAAVSQAQANTIGITLDGSTVVRATVSDSSLAATLLGFVDLQGNQSPALATAFDTGNSGEATELSYINMLAGTNFTTLDKTHASGEYFTFTIDAPYFLVKVGGGGAGNLHAFFENTSLVALTLIYDKLEFDKAAKKLGYGKGFGLSHISEFGTLSPVPLPAAAPLFAAALGLVALFGHRRKRKAARA